MGLGKTGIPEGSAGREGKERPLVFSLYSHQPSHSNSKEGKGVVLGLEPRKRGSEEENPLPEGANTPGKPGLQQGEKVSQTCALGPKF